MTSPRQKEWEFSERSERTERSERQIEYALRNEDGASAVMSLRHSRCVVVFRVGAISTARCRTLARDAIQFP